MGNDLKQYIRNVADFPKKGIVFRDITTLLKDPKAIQLAADRMYEHYKNSNIQKVVGIESRGFILGGALALRLGVGFVPIRKKGKLPAATVREEYQLEYGIDSIEIHSDALNAGERVLLHDDLLATGGTMRAAIRLVNNVGGSVAGVSFLIDLSFLHEQNIFGEIKYFSLTQYDSE